jgi:hypothetical protein
MPIDYNNPSCLPHCCGELIEPVKPLTCTKCNTTYDADEVVGKMKRIKKERRAGRKMVAALMEAIADAK